MFFGKSAPESIGPDGLEPMLNSMFDRKLGQLESKAQKTTQELANARDRFADACDRLEELDVQPYTEDLWMVNINSIKSQKAQYTRVLKKVINEMSLENDAASNSYEKYMKILSSVESISNEVLKTNATFKQTLYCYSNYLRDFKKSFSDIERFRDSLKQELDSKSREFSEYSTLKESILKLRMQGEELETLEQSVKALKDSMNGSSSSVREHDEAGLSESLAKRNSELADVKAQISRTSDRISLLTIPLERPSKKLDHISGRKRQLHAFIADPIGSIKDENDYNEFKSMIQELRDAIDKGTVDVKNKAESVNVISTLMNADIYGMINSLKSLQRQRSEIEGEVRAIEISLADIHKGRSASERTAHDMAAMEDGKLKTAKEMEGTKKMIESLFSSYYRKPISIGL